jgi:hypothetical protein
MYGYHQLPMIRSLISFSHLAQILIEELFTNRLNLAQLFILDSPNSSPLWSNVNLANRQEPPRSKQASTCWLYNGLTP